MAPKQAHQVGSPRVAERLADWLLKRAPASKTTVVGISGAQGSGKTTLTRRLVRVLDEQGAIATSLSLDDFYLSRSKRGRLAKQVHPLFATRGVPKTHEVKRLGDALTKLATGGAVSVPVFDKARDDRLPPGEWRTIEAARYRFVLVEGWCLGVPPEPDEALVEPINALEEREDGDGRWRRQVNDALAGEYRELFDRLDVLVLLVAPSFERVYGWRAEQEAELRTRMRGTATMGRPELERFVMHFERLTRRALEALPDRADAVLYLGPSREVERWVLR